MAALVETIMEKTSQSSYSIFVEQNNAVGQDFVKVIKVDNEEEGEIYWLIVLDGHGKHRYGRLAEGKKDMVSWLQTTYNWEHLVLNNPDNPIMFLQDAIAEEYEDTCGIGACCSIAKVSNNKITIWWIGDSVMKVYSGDEVVAETRVIKMSDPDEIERQAKQNLNITETSAWNIKAVNSSQLTMIASKYYHVQSGTDEEKVAIIQSLGHNLAYGSSNNRIEVDLDENKPYKIVGGSDGLWDVYADTEDDMAMVSDMDIDAKALGALASERWKQEWDYVWNGTVQGKQKIPNPDDICCVTFHKSI